MSRVDLLLLPSKETGGALSFLVWGLHLISLFSCVCISLVGLALMMRPERDRVASNDFASLL